jgi:hypothetical protein
MPANHTSNFSSSSSTARTTRDLTVAQRWLFDVIRNQQFGRIENMPVRAGQPLLDRSARVVRITRLDSDGREGAPGGDDVELKRPFCELFDELMRLQDCLVVRLEFRHGLPLQLETTPPCGESAIDESGGQIPRTRGSRK